MSPSKAGRTILRHLLILAGVAAWSSSIQCHQQGFWRPQLCSNIFLRAASNTDDVSIRLKAQYAEARNTRTLKGHDAAMPLYQNLLEMNPGDRTAATRIAASPATPFRHDKACLIDDDDDDASKQKTNIQMLQKMLLECNYSHTKVADFFQVPPHTYLSCEGPLFVAPVSAGSISTFNYPLFRESKPSPLTCLVSLFLLGLAVPKQWLEEALGEQYCQLMQDFGWVFPCSIDTNIMVPYVHVFPLDFYHSRSDSSKQQQQTTTTTLYLVTDLHPRILSTVTVGAQSTEGNAVMYIGPDSLALVQHFDPFSYLLSSGSSSVVTEKQQSSSEANKYKNKKDIYGLDLGTGSGIQALSALTRWKMALEDLGETKKPRLHFHLVDVNPRALRFAHFNAVLNGLDEQVSLIEADLVTGMSHGSTLEEQLQGTPLYLILANPPFLPVPSENGDSQDTTSHQTSSKDGVKNEKYDLESINRRYGLFSSGGPSGEGMLRRIIEFSSRHLYPGGFLGVVSEFFFQQQDSHFQRFSHWWESIGNYDSPGSTGVLFVNEFPITAEIYAARRADTPEEEDIWIRHLQSLNITAGSPGLLYIQKGKIKASSGTTDQSFLLGLKIAKVPKSNLGSIWTPSNRYAIQYTQKMAKKVFLGERFPN